MSRLVQIRMQHTANLPQVAEINIPQSMDVAGECSLYYESMISAYIADALSEERSALRLVLMDRNIEVVGEAAGWTTASAHAPMSCTDMLLVEGIYSPTRLMQLQQKSEMFCPAALVITLISHLDARQQAALDDASWRMRT
jgi:hypothetical protein